MCIENTEFILVLLFIIVIIFHTNSCKPIFVLVNSLKHAILRHLPQGKKNELMKEKHPNKRGKKRCKKRNSQK